MVTITGAGSDVSPASNTVITGSGTGLNLSAGTDALNRVVVQNIRVTGFSTGVIASSYNTLENVASISNTTYGISLNTLTDLAISNSKFNDNGLGLKLGSTASASYVTITDSQFNGNLNQGWYSDKNAASGSFLTNLNISSTTFNNNVNKGFYTEKLSDSIFNNVTVNGSGIGGALNHRAGIDINLKYGTYQSIQILNSTIINSGTGDPNGAGIIIKARSSGSYGATPATLTNVTLSGLTVTGNGGGGAYASGVRIGEANNSLTGSDTGPSGVVISDSRVYDNSTFDVNNVTASTTVDANNNWWGQALGPNTSQYNGSVTVDSWCDVSTCATYQSTAPDGTTTLPAGESADLSGSQTGNMATVPDTNDVVLTDGSVTAKLEKGTEVTAIGVGLWDGQINAPSFATVSIPNPSGFTAAPLTQIEIGSPDFSLSFSNAARLVFPGQSGKHVGFVDSLGNFNEITTPCNANDQASANAQLVMLPGSPSECLVNSSPDLVVWTKHFTKFATYTLTANAVSGGSGGGSTASSSAATTSSTTTTTSSSKPASAFGAFGGFGGLFGDDGLTAGQAISTLNPSNKAGSGLSGAKASVVAAAKNSGMKWYWWVVIVLLAGSLVGGYVYNAANRDVKSSSGR